MNITRDLAFAIRDALGEDNEYECFDVDEHGDLIGTDKRFVVTFVDVSDPNNPQVLVIDDENKPQQYELRIVRIG